MDRAEHLEWCKTRALEYIDQNDLVNAWASMALDLRKHDETKEHAGIALGVTMLMSGHLTSSSEMRNFINGFN